MVAIMVTKKLIVIAFIFMNEFSMRRQLPLFKRNEDF
jgi:hypothetical protein